jgi:riboflavin synthase
MDLSDVAAGDSIAVNGVCLTALRAGSLEFDLGPETLAKTTLGSLEQGTRVHLEKALRMSDRLGGHFVQGHVDGVGEVAYLERLGEALEIGFNAPQEIIRLCIPKGSIAINGISLTINSINECRFSVCLVPHTLEKTTLGALQGGDRVNLENDMLVKTLSQMHFNRPVPIKPSCKCNCAGI